LFFSAFYDKINLIDFKRKKENKMAFKRDLDRSATNRLLRKFEIANYIVRLSDLQDIATKYGRTDVSFEVKKCMKVINIIKEGEKLFFEKQNIARKEQKYLNSNVDIIKYFSEDLADDRTNCLDLARGLVGAGFDFNDNEEVIRDFTSNVLREDAFSLLDAFDKGGVVLSDESAKDMIDRYNDRLYKPVLIDEIEGMNRKNSKQEVKSQRVKHTPKSKRIKKQSAEALTV
jgi:hypothetical protein